MKFGVVIFPGSNCDRDVIDALQNDLDQEVITLWHKHKDLSMFDTSDCIVLPGRMRYGLINLRKMMIEKQIAL